MKLNIVIKAKKVKRELFEEDIESLDKGIQIQVGNIECNQMNDWDIKAKKERENDKKYPKDRSFEDKLEKLDKRLKKISDPKEADILILQTLNHISPEEDSQCRRQLFNYLKPKEVLL